MSLITEVTIVLEMPEPEVMEHIQSFTWGGPNELARVAYFGKLDTDAAGGSKVYCGEVWAAAFNYLPQAEFIEHLEAAPWNRYNHTVVVISGEDYESFTVFRPPPPVVSDSRGAEE